MPVLSRRIALAATAAVLALVALPACEHKAQPTPQSGSDEMGMAMGGGSGAIVAPGSASIEGSITQSPDGRLIAEAVVSPVDGWLVVRSAIDDGVVLGVAPVGKGRSSDVSVQLESPDSTMVNIGLHADAGTKGAFEFDPTSETPGIDKPLRVGSDDVLSTLVLRDFGVDVSSLGAREPTPSVTAQEGEHGHGPSGGSRMAISLVVGEQTGPADTVKLRHAIVPDDAFVIVQSIDAGRPGPIVGSARIGSGFVISEPIALDAGSATGEVLVTLVSDGGTAGRLEYDPRRPFESADQPFTVNGVTISERVRLGTGAAPQ